MQPISRVRYLILPLLLAGSVAVAVGPSGWRITWAWLAGVCMSVISELGVLEIGTVSVLLVAAGASVAGAWSAVRMARRHATLSRTLQSQVVATRGWRAGGERTYLVFSDAAPAAFCEGLIRPRIYVSDSLIRTLTSRELEAVLEHELAHKCRRDPLRIAMARVVSNALVLIPLARSLFDRYLLNLELKADAEALQQVGSTHLVAALAKLLNSRNERLGGAAVSGFDHVGARLDALVRPERNTSAHAGRLSRRHITAALVWGALVFGGWSYAVWGAATVLAASPSCPMQL